MCNLLTHSTERGRPRPSEDEAGFPREITPPRFALHLRLSHTYNHHMISSPTLKYHAYNYYRSIICPGKGGCYEAVEELEWIGKPSSCRRALQQTLQGFEEAYVLADLGDIYRRHSDSNNAILGYQMVKVPDGECARDYGLRQV